MVEKKKTGSLHYRLIKKVFIAAISASSFLGIQPKFIKPFTLKYVMAEPIQETALSEKECQRIAETTFNLIMTIITSPNKSEIGDAFKRFETIDKNAKQYPIQSLVDIRNKIKDKINSSKIKQLFENYRQYYNKQQKNKEPKIRDFVVDLVKAKEELTEGKKSGLPKKLVESIKEAIKEVRSLGAVPIIKDLEVIKARINSGISYIEKRIEGIEDITKDIREKVERNIKDNDSKQRISSVLTRWEENTKKFKSDLDKIKEKKLQYLSEAREVETELENVAKKIDDFIKNEFVSKNEFRLIYQAVLFFVNALYTGEETAVTEAEKARGMLENMKQTAPLKYTFCVNLINELIKDIAPQVYEAMHTIKDVRSAIDAVLAAEAKQEEAALKKIYGQYFVEYVKENERELKAAGELSKRIVNTASLLLYVSEDLIDAIEDVVGTNDKAKYGEGFFVAVNENGEINSFASNLENRRGDKIDVIKLAEEKPERFLKIKENYWPIQEAYIIGGMGSVVLQMNIFRQNLNLAMDDINSDKATEAFNNAFVLYKSYFGDNPTFLKLVYDIDTIAGKKIETFEEAKLFSKIVENLKEELNIALINQAIEEGAVDIFAMHYISKAIDEIAKKYRNDEGVLEALVESITTMATLDPWLLPQYYEKVMKPMAEVFESGQQQDFVWSLMTFNGLVHNRYQRTSFLVEQRRENFVKIFDNFEKGIPKAKEMMTHRELEYETRQRSELGQFEVYPPYNLYMQKIPELLEMTDINLPYLQRAPALDILPHPMLPNVASLPYGPIQVNSDAERLYQKLNLQLRPFSPVVGQPFLSAAFMISKVSRQVMLQHISKAFGSVSLYAPTDLISAMAEVGAYAAGTKEVFAGGGRVEAQGRFPEGSLLGQLSYLLAKEGASESHGVTAATAGGGVGPFVRVDNTFTFREEKEQSLSETAFSAALNNLVAFSKQTGESLLLYVPELSRYEKTETIEETRPGETKSEEETRLGGKMYFIDSNGDVYQLSMGYNDFDQFRQFIYGSAETENLLASIRKYGWTETDFGDFGGAIGFTISEFAAFMMEDAIRRATFNVAPSIRKDPNTGLMIKELDMRVGQVLGYHGVFATAIENAIWGGTTAFIARVEKPQTEGIYTGEIIWRKIKPETEMEIRGIGGYPLTAGTSIKIISKEGEKRRGYYGKAAIAAMHFWENLFSAEMEAEAIANYVSTKLGEFYYWDEDKQKQERNFLGLSLMFANLGEQGEDLKKLMKEFEWDDTYFSVVAAHYAKKWGAFLITQRVPGFAEDLEYISQIIEKGRNDIGAYPEWGDEISRMIADQIARMKEQKKWRGAAGIELNFDTWTMTILGRTEIEKYQNKTELGHSLIEGVAFAGYKRWIEPFFQANILSYQYTAQQGYTNYLDLLFSLGAANLNITAMSKTFDYQFSAGTKESLMDFLQTRPALKDALEYLTKEKVAEGFTAVFAENAHKADFDRYYYILVDMSSKKCYIGNEDDRKSWVEGGYTDKQIYSLKIEENKVSITVPDTSETSWFKSLKLVGGIPLELKGEDAKRVGWTAGLLLRMFEDYKTDIILAALGGKKELEEFDISQYSIVLSSKWDGVNFITLGERVYGYIMVNHLDKTITIKPSEPPTEVELTTKEVERTTFGGGVTLVYFDGLLGETKRLNIYVEGGWEILSIPGKEFVGRLGLTFESRQSLFGQEGWFNIGLVGWLGWWPLGQPLNIADFSTIPQNIYYDSFNINWPLSQPWGSMLYLGWRW